MIKYPKITDISLSFRNIEKKIPKVLIRYRYIDIGDISTIFSIYRPISRSTTLSVSKRIHL